MRVETVTIDEGGVLVRREVVCLGDPDTSNAMAATTNAQPASTSWGVVIRQVGDSTITPVAGSTFNVRPLQSSAADLQVTATPAAGSTFNVRPLQSSAADLQVTATPASTVWAVQVDGRVRAQNSTILDLLASVQQNSTVWAVQVDGRVRAQNSTIGDLLASVQQNSTVWQTQAKILDSSAVGFVGSITRPTTAAQGLLTRTILNDLQSTVNSTAGNNSTTSTIVSSVAALRVKVYAFSVTSTAQGNSSLSFRSSGAANYIWGVDFRTLSSAMGGANLAVSPPAWLFATEAGSALAFGHQGATGTFVVSVAYFLEA